MASVVLGVKKQLFPCGHCTDMVWFFYRMLKNHHVVRDTAFKTGLEILVYDLQMALLHE